MYEDMDTSGKLNRLLKENADLLKEVRSGRVSSSMVAELVAQQSVLIEEILLKFEGDVAEEIILQHNLNMKLEEAHVHESEIAEDRERLDEMQISTTQMMKELSMAQQAAKAASKVKSVFLSNMSHEIRTPLNGVIGMTKILMDTELTSQQRVYSEAVVNSATTLLYIINDILDYSKIDAEKITLEELELDPVMLVEDLSDPLAIKAHEKGIEYLVYIDDRVPETIIGDSRRLRQLLTNLLGNAIKFTSSGFVALSIIVSDESNDSISLDFNVRDTGIGISADKINNLFDAFSQLDDSTTKKYEGTGLGLAISEKLAEMMGGKISIESTINEGSSFTLIARFLKGKPKEILERGSLEVWRNRRVLVVDNRELNRRYLSDMLSNIGCRVEQATTGLEALEILRSRLPGVDPFDMIFIDDELSDVSGETLSMNIMADPSMSGVRMILMPQIGTTIEKDSLKQKGFIDFIKKPFRRNRLFQLLKEINEKEIQALEESDEKIDDPFDGAFKSVPRILLAEDNKVNQKVACLMLEKAGFSVDVVENGLRAMEAVEALSYDLILMDCMMPEMSGYEATAGIRKMDGKKGRTPIIALTANAMMGDREKCIEAGMDDYLSKPINKSIMLELIERYLPSSEKV